MVPKLHAKGRSFKGAAAYLLHDKGRAQSAERVAWTDVRNLGTENPHAAWKVMAATAMKQDDLKELAGVKKTGRKSADSVLHFSLAWHPEEKAGLTREEMTRGALGALKALGASDRQALIICHGDEEQPHIHILVNRVSAEDGRMLSSSKEKLQLSKWAESYERERGQIYCEERVLNNEARDRDKHTRGKKDRPRHLYEAEQQYVIDEQTKAELRRKEAIFARKARDVRQRQKNAWAELEKQHKQRATDIRARAVKETTKQKEAIRAGLKPEYQTLFQKHQEGMAGFLQKEKSLLGRVQNALKAIDFKAILRGEADPENGARRGVLGQTFEALSNAGARLETLKRQQATEKRSLEARENRAEREAAARERQQREEELRRNRERYEKERNDLILAQQMDAAKIRAERMIRTQLRNHAEEEAGRREVTAAPETPQVITGPDPEYIRQKLQERQERKTQRDSRER